MKNTKTTQCRFQRTHLSRAATGAAAIATTATTLMTAHGEVVYSGARNLSTSSRIGEVFAEDIEQVDLDGMAPSEFTLSSFNTKGSDFHWMDTASHFAPIKDMTEAFYLARLPAGTLIGPASNFSTSPGGEVFIDNLTESTILSGFGDGIWAPASDGYLGFRFNPTGTQELYGWGHVSISDDATILTLKDWAYESSGAPIPAGVVPEPTTNLLVLTSLAVAAIWRRWIGGAGNNMSR
jgi:hypothetical protein